MVQGRIGPERQSLSKVWNNRHAAFRLSGLKKGDYILQRTRILAPEASTVSRRSRIRLGLYYKIPRRRISGVKTGNGEFESRYGKVYNRAKKCDQKNENMIKRRVSASLFIQAYFPQASSVGRTRLPAVLISGTKFSGQEKTSVPTLFLLGKFHNDRTLSLMLPLYPDYGQGPGITTLFPLGVSVGIVFE